MLIFYLFGFKFCGISLNSSSSEDSSFSEPSESPKEPSSLSESSGKSSLGMYNSVSGVYFNFSGIGFVKYSLMSSIVANPFPWIDIARFFDGFG